MSTRRVESSAGVDAQAGCFVDGRLHLHHGPIDLIIGAEGDARDVALAYAQARDRFAGLLAELVAELPLLRNAVQGGGPSPSGSVARRMFDAARVHEGEFATPMIAVAGAVADEVLDALTKRRALSRAYVNNGGDIAIHIAPGASYRAGLVADSCAGTLAGTVQLSFENPARGIATSGWRGRSHSLGIADAVTVLARTAAEADAAATLIANAVNVDDPDIVRRAAREMDERTDLGDRLVTVDVPRLDAGAVAAALQNGMARARLALASGQITAAALFVQGESRVADNGRSIQMEALKSP